MKFPIKTIDFESEGSARKTAGIAIAASAVIVIAVILFLAGRPVLPSWIVWQDKAQGVSVGDQMIVHLRGKEVVVTKVAVDNTNPGEIASTIEETLWHSEGGVRVSDYLIGDIDGDSNPEMLLLVWKQGSYGQHRPFWVSEDTAKYTQHIYIYSIRKDLIKPVWMSSELEMKIKDWSLDKSGHLHITDTDGISTVWGWVSWGLMRLD